MKNKSLKGVWGTVGAPPKVIKFPAVGTTFTLNRLFKANTHVCQLTVRKRVEDEVSLGNIQMESETKKKGKHQVGRPNFLYTVLKTPSNPAKDVLVKTRKTTKTTVPVATVAPTVPVATPVPASAPTTPVVPVTNPDNEPATV